MRDPTIICKKTRKTTIGTKLREKLRRLSLTMTGRFVRDQSAMTKAIASSGKAGQETTKQTTSAEKLESENALLSTVKEMNQGWMSRLGAGNDYDETEADPADTYGDTEADLPPTIKPEHIKKETRKQDKALGIKNVAGTSESERKALKQWDEDENKSDTEKLAFLAGFRYRQDHNSVVLRAQTEQLKSLVDILTSSATSVSRAASDIVNATTMSTSKLAAAITKHIEVPPHETLTKIEMPKLPLISSEAGSISGVKSVDGKSVDEEIIDSNKKESTRIKEEAKTPKPQIVTPPVIDSGPIITVGQMASVLGGEVKDILEFYEIGMEKFESVAKDLGLSYEGLLRKYGGLSGLKGTLKKKINLL